MKRDKKNKEINDNTRIFKKIKKNLISSLFNEELVNLFICMVNLDMKETIFIA